MKKLFDLSGSEKKRKPDEPVQNITSFNKLVGS
jgi:hypothetical protein